MKSTIRYTAIIIQMNRHGEQVADVHFAVRQEPSLEQVESLSGVTELSEFGVMELSPVKAGCRYSEPQSASCG